MAKEETYVEYLRRVGADYRASDPESATAEDYDNAANRIASLEQAVDPRLRQALIKLVDAFGLDDRSMFEPDQRKALAYAERALKACKGDPLAKLETAVEGCAYDMYGSLYSMIDARKVVVAAREVCGLKPMPEN